MHRKNIVLILVGLLIMGALIKIILENQLLRTIFIILVISGLMLLVVQSNKARTIAWGFISVITAICVCLVIINPSIAEAETVQTPTSAPQPALTPTQTTESLPVDPQPSETLTPVETRVVQLVYGVDCDLNPSWLDHPAIAQWERLMEDACLIHGVPVDLIASVMLQESGGNPEPGETIQTIDGRTIHSSVSGAIGLLQVMPKDGIAANCMCINGPCFAERPGAIALLDPEFNVMYGARMLSGLFNNLGDWRDALAHYGPEYKEEPWRYYEYADTVLAHLANHP